MKLPTFNFKDLQKPRESKLFLALVPTLKEKKTQQFTTLALTFITIVFFGFFAIAPTIGTISDLQKQVSDNVFVNNSLQTKIANLTTLQTKYTQLQSQLTPVYNAVPTDPGIDSLAGQLHQIALDTNVQINRVETLSIDLSPATLSKPYVSYAFTVEAQGDMSSLESYMKSLGNFDRLITFDSIDFAQSDAIAQTFRMTLRGETYFKSE